MDNILKELLETYGVSGNEEAVRDVIKRELSGLDCTIHEDKMGNLIAKLGQGEQKLMICAHMDQIGVIATYIEESGLIRVGSVGDFNAEDAANSTVRFKNGTVGRLCRSKDDMFVDIGASNKAEVLCKIKEGDTACFIGAIQEFNEDKIAAPNLDDRIGCYILIKLAKEMKAKGREIYIVFSTQEELGARGSRAAAFAIDPDICIVVDVEKAGDVIGGEGNVKLAAGPVIKVIDKTLIMHHEVKGMLENAAKESNLSIQYTVSSGKSDGGSIHKERSGIKTGELSIPIRYKHTGAEMVSLKDVNAALKLLSNI